MKQVASIRAGTVLDERYVLDRPIGSGGYGMVFEAHDTRVGRQVAIKTMQVADDGIAASFRREASLLASVDSPHVVRVLDASLDRDTPYLVMELLDGISVRHRLSARGPFPIELAIGVTAGLLRGLRALHQRAIVHLDVKPSNVMLCSSGTKLIDFGISRPGGLDPWDPKLLRGTPPYLAPELLARREPDVRTDLYGAGLVLYEMLSGKRAFRGTKEVSALLADIRDGRHTPLRVHCPWLDVTVTSFVRMALASDPDQRFTNAEEMLTALDLVGRSVVEKPSSQAPSQTPSDPAIASVVAASRVETLVRDERVRERFLKRGGRTRFLDELDLRPWVPLSEYCRLLDSAYAVLGQSVLAEVTRARVVAESRDGPFVAAAQASRDDLGRLISGYWKTAFRDAGGVRVVSDSRGLRLTIVGASSQIRSSPGWRTALTGSLLGVLEVAGLSGEVRLREEDGMVSWFMDLDGGPSRLRIGPVAPGPEPTNELIAGRYHLQRPLGTGAFGHVWEARDVHLDRSVAIKWLSGQSDLAVLRERASVLAAIRSANVVRVLDIDTAADGRPLLVMELANGPTLATILGDVLPIESVCAIGKSALGGLAAMHASGAVHGSVVPSSLLLSHAHGERQLKWIGFDLSSPDRPRPLPPGYSAPELVRGARPTPRSDVFGLGATLFQLAAGVLPFPPSQYASPTDLREAMERTPWSVVAALGRLPPEIGAVLERALAPNPEDRYRDAQEMRTACESVFE